MQTSLLFILLFVAKTLKKNVGLVWFCYCHHFYIFCVKSDDLREWKFTNLTFKFSKIVRRSNGFELFLHFTVDPSLQTSHMYQSTTSLTFAWRNQRIILRLFTTQTHLTILLTFLHSLIMLNSIFTNFKHSIYLSKMIRITKCKSFLLILRFNNHILHTAQFYHISRFCIIISLLNE